MELKYNVTGTDRKRLVKAISKIIGQEPKYLGVPNYEYKVGRYIIDQNGTLKFDIAEIEEQEINELIDKLQKEGFILKENSPDTPLEIKIAIPINDVDERAKNNLKNMLEAKKELIKKALNIETVEIKMTDEMIEFPWFKEEIEGKDLNVYMDFIGALVKMAKEKHHISPKVKAVQNERYAFRCFLLRLGYIGNAYKEARKVLLKNLSGSSAFRVPKSSD